MTERPCPQCGVTYPYEEEICPACGYQVEPRALLAKKKPWIAAILSMFIFGAGQVYNGQIRKGIMFLIAIFIGIFIFLVPGVFLWLFGIYDAVVTSRRMNTNEVSPAPTQLGYLALFIFIVLFIYVVIGVVAGGYSEAIFFLRPPGL